MTGKLRRAVIACLVVAGLWAGLLVGLVVLMELSWSIWAASPAHRYDPALRFIFNAYLFVIWIGILPTFVLRRKCIRSVPAYFIAGIVSSLLATYSMVFAMEFGVPLAFCCVPPPTLRSLLLLAFTDGRELISEMIRQNGDLPVVLLAVPGIFWGLLGWSLFRPGARHAT